MLEAPIMEEGLTSAIQAIAKGKSLGLDGLTANFLMSTEFTIMVNESLRHG